MAKEQLCAYGCGVVFVPQHQRGRNTARGHQDCYNAQRKRATEIAREHSDQLRQLIEPAAGFAEPVRAPKREHPKGWEPHVEENGNTATAVSAPLENSNPEEADLIRGWSLDPAHWRIVGPLNCRRWQANAPVIEEGKTVGYEAKWLYYYKANLERIDPIKTAELESLCEEIRKHKPKKATAPSGDDSFLVCVADVQMGKSDGDGSAGTAGRFLAAIDAVEHRIAELRKTGRELGTLYILGMGDLIESCSEHYAQQAFRTQLNLRDQVKVMRQLILKAIERWAPLFARVVIAPVGGNHGENRRDGKSFTDFADNHDVAIFEQVQTALSMNPEAYGHVSFSIPNSELTQTLDVSGVIVGITHGHVAGKGSSTNVGKKLVDWWMKQAHGQQPIGDAKILITAHYHHLIVTESGAKTHIQCPALEGGSDWWRDMTGQQSRPGVLTLRIGAGVSPAGWADLAVV